MLMDTIGFACASFIISGGITSLIAIGISILFPVSKNKKDDNTTDADAAESFSRAFDKAVKHDIRLAIKGFLIGGIAWSFITVPIHLIMTNKPENPYDGLCNKVEVYHYKDHKMTNTYSKVIFDDIDHIEERDDMIIIYLKPKEGEC